MKTAFVSLLIKTDIQNEDKLTLFLYSGHSLSLVPHQLQLALDE